MITYKKFQKSYSPRVSLVGDLVSFRSSMCSSSGNPSPRLWFRWPWWAERGGEGSERLGFRWGWRGGAPPVRDRAGSRYWCPSTWPFWRGPSSPRSSSSLTWTLAWSSPSLSLATHTPHLLRLLFSMVNFTDLLLDFIFCFLFCSPLDVWIHSSLICGSDL